MKTPVFVFDSLNLVRGGLTKAVITRANMLTNEFDEVIFLTLRFQSNFHEIVNKLYDSGQLNKKIKVFNLFDDVMTNKLLPDRRIKKRKPVYQVQEKGFDIFKDKRDVPPSYRYYKNGLYIKYKRFNNKNKLVFIDYMTEGRNRYRREEFDLYGNLVVARHMDTRTNKPSLERYLDAKGKCYLSVWIDSEGNPYRTLLLNNKQNKEFKSFFNFKADWINKKMEDITNPVLISDSRKTDELVTSIEGKKIAVLHNNHYKKPYDGSNGFKETWDYFLNNINLFNQVVFLTDEQREDIKKEIGEKSNYIVIPHAAAPVSNYNTNYDPLLAVSVARYTGQKRLNEAIKAFSYVVKELPNAEYHIYGFGEQKNSLQKLIGELGLEDNVKLKGFTTNPTEVYQKACCSILTSAYEGFGMVITESLAAGTPVVSFDVKYGPKDIIRDGVDGFVISQRNKEIMADKIIELMTNQSLRQQLAKNSKDVLERFSSSDYSKHWVNIIKTV
ncbi:poly(glycerol-phosphate) alpha-glucosyltransferase [Paraliobacillus ryukyuensis]|uniref:Poly(Glycerol-phosphate) alpha-glucosyltransferase n=1 Tax=Paraliobacillus ryukyuensis TaxID=200904 RepID=A0A366EE50_9BACI|nr:glycosyltransferase [Paraliobacillus ryukyuensis]RBP00588.1 poly(glycerol-phosphate) alpha-glucosyltransferase [Paraliobacillus ryukyuensis]